MKKILLILGLVLSFNTMASSDPFDKATHACVANEMIKKYPIYSKVIISDFITFALDDQNFDYMILLADPLTRRVDSRSFILVRNGVANAQLYFNEFSSPSKIDLTNCF